MDFRSKILLTAYKLFPFSLKGDAKLYNIDFDCDISCVVNFYGRINLLEGIFYSLSEQSIPKKRFEIVLIEDKGGTEDGKNISGKFGDILNIRYYPLPENHGRMGYSRNFGLSLARGKYILFLDDDTVILQQDFLKNLIEEFEESRADAIVPHGISSYSLLKGRYNYHDPYFPTNRCMAYQRDVLRELGGFVSEIIGQEDVEFVIRFIASGRRFHNSEKLEYFHPPLIVNNLNKAAAVGVSFAKLKKRYPFIVWLMLLINGSRCLPLLLMPFNTKWRMQGRFSLGFSLGIIYSMMGKEIRYN